METKRCSLCKNDLPATDEFFASRYDKKEVQLQGTCRLCQKKYRKDHYKKHKQKYIDKAKDYRIKVRDWFNDLKKDLFCEVCGEDRYWVLDFHHNDPLQKDNEVTNLVRDCSKEKIIEEIKKCKVLCSNCHRDLHHKERQAEIV